LANLKTKKQNMRTKINWNNYSKSTIAIAMDESLSPKQFPSEWHEFILVPQSNDVGGGFWTLLGQCSDHSQMLINQKYQPTFHGHWNRSLFVRPHIEEYVASQLHKRIHAGQWDDAIIEAVNLWLKYGHEITSERVRKIRKRMERAAAQYRSDDDDREEYVSSGDDDERIA
jgi:hypothetical protein